MKIYYNSGLAKQLLFGTFYAAMFFGAIITTEATLSPKDRNHEAIHVWQYWVTLILGLLVWVPLAIFASWWFLAAVPFTYYLMYGIEWAISYAYHVCRGDAREKWNDLAYHATSFEMEAYGNEGNPDYLSSFPVLGFIKYYGTI